MNQTNEDDIVDIVRKALGDTRQQITIDSLMKDVPEWDSLAHLQILVDLDSKFDGRVADINEMAEADSVQKIVDLLKQHSLIT